MASRKRKTLSDGLRAAIAASPHSLREISRRTNIAPAVLSRFMNGLGGLSMEGIESLADALALDIAVKARRARTRKG